jgi:DNA-3-methyladenine glycosylase II
LGSALEGRCTAQSLVELPEPERVLSARDSTLARVIVADSARWPSQPTEDVIWGLIRIVIAQQISTRMACRIAERVKLHYPSLIKPSPDVIPNLATLRALGLTERRAQCCIDIVRCSDEIRMNVERGQAWEQALAGIKGIGPWTISVFRIMVLREPDELPLGDVGLQRAIVTLYGTLQNAESLGDMWRPFRSVACWYLWRTLGNEQLG